jgi:hypothetical protein
MSKKTYHEGKAGYLNIISYQQAGAGGESEAGTMYFAHFINCRILTIDPESV